MTFENVEVVDLTDIRASVEYKGSYMCKYFVTEAEYNQLLKEYNELKSLSSSLEK